MKNETIRNKVKVFISSRECRSDEDRSKINFERYRYVRRAIKELLEETNMAQVFVRELEGTAGSQPITGEYLHALRICDICIFIIDNEDDKETHADGVVKEYEEAKKQGKKMMFVFCDEFSKANTQIAKEVKNSSGPTCSTAHTFDEIPCIVYNSVINDIINIYKRYCYPPHQDIDSTFEVSMQPSQIMLNSRSKGFNLVEYPVLQNAMNALMGVKETLPTGEPYDILCADLFSFIMFRSNYDENKLKSLEEEILKIHEEAYHEVYKDRTTAFKHYLSGDIEKCYDFLQKAHLKAKEISSFPNWLLLDILVDLRNIEFYIAKENNDFIYESRWQKEISSNSEIVYYPVLDRYTENHFESIDRFLREHETDSPYTARLGNQFNSLFENCFVAFAVAVSNVSITQILCVREQLIAAFSAVCRIYKAPSQFAELICLLIIEERDKDIKEHIDALGYTQNISSFNAIDVKNILDAVLRIPQKKHRAYATIILFHHFGYYFSDDDSILISGKINEIITDFLNGEKYTKKLIYALTKAIGENDRRINANDIVDYIIQFTKFDTPDAIGATELLSSECFKNIDEKNKKKLVDAYIQSCKRGNNQVLDTTLDGLMILRKLYPKFTAIIDATVLERDENYYYSDYALELGLSNQNGENIDHIDRFIKSVASQNETQGKHGTYTGYASEPLVVLSNIVRNSFETISENQVSEIGDVAIETLTTNTQTFSAKIYAAQLLLQLCNYCDYKPTNELQQLLVNNQESILVGWGDGLFNKDTQALLAFNLTLLKTRLGENLSYDFIAGISQSNIPDYNHIKMAKAINIYCSKNDWSNTSNEILLSILHFSLTGCGHKDYEVRLLSCRTLFELLRSSYKKLVSDQLSTIMDNADWILAQDIVYHISKADDIDKGLKDFVLQKAQSSNHFVVREMAQKFLVEK
jgi:hypothetical protein